MANTSQEEMGSSSRHQPPNQKTQNPLVPRMVCLNNAVKEVLWLGVGATDYRLESIGWKTYLQQRRGTSKITINKLVSVVAGLEKGQFLYCYLAKDKDERSVVVVYLDGKERR
ncbi:MAG: hypothetical protein AABY92_07875 [Thermodesulfobacteriota bacterium]